MPPCTCTQVTCFCDRGLFYFNRGKWTVACIERAARTRSLAARYGQCWLEIRNIQCPPAASQDHSRCPSSDLVCDRAKDGKRGVAVSQASPARPGPHRQSEAAVAAPDHQYRPRACTRCRGRRKTRNVAQRTRFLGVADVRASHIPRHQGELDTQEDVFAFSAP